MAEWKGERTEEGTEALRHEGTKQTEGAPSGGEAPPQIPGEEGSAEAADLSEEEEAEVGVGEAVEERAPSAAKRGTSPERGEEGEAAPSGEAPPPPPGAGEEEAGWAG